MNVWKCKETVNEDFNTLKYFLTGCKLSLTA